MPSFSPSPAPSSTGRPSEPTMTAPSGPSARSSRFIGGVPMKPAAKTLAGRSYSWSGAPACTTRPSRSRMTLSAMDMASLWSWVT